MSLKIKKYQGILCIISIIIVSVWFGEKKILATAEEGIPYYNPIRTLNLFSSNFYDTGLGYDGAYNISRIPLAWLNAVLSTTRLDTWKIQAIVFFFLILTPLLCLQKLAIYINDNPDVGLFAAIFYLCNLFVMSQIWNRFVSSLIFLWSYLPIFLLIWITLLKTKKIKYIFILSLSSIVYSNMFITISPLITIWFCGGIYFLFNIYQSKKKKKDIIIGFLCGAIFLICNLWWIIPVFSLQKNSTGSNLNTKSNIQTVNDVSKYFDNTNILTLTQKYMFGPKSPYQIFYLRSSIKLVSVMVIGILTIGIYCAAREKKARWILCMLFFGWFISKGVNPPLGKEFYNFIFANVPFTQVYRNPYEKFGVVFVLAYSLLFAIGLTKLFDTTSTVKKYILILTVIIVNGYLVSPIWQGTLFSSSNYVTVPEDYKKINEIINNGSNDQNRIFMLPFLHGSEIKYTWGYSGEEASEFLFDHSSISRIFSNPEVDEFYYQLGKSNLFRQNKNFNKILTTALVDTIIIHKDIVKSTYHQESYEDTLKIVENWNGSEKIAENSTFSVYRISGKKIATRAYIVDKLYFVNNIEEYFNEATKNEFDPTTDAGIILSQNKSTPMGIGLSYSTPDYQVISVSKTKYMLKINQAQGPFVVILSNNYSPYWKLFVNENENLNKLKVNGFANGWIVEQKGSYNIDIIYSLWN